MAALPDELLLMIFAHVTDADTLLDGVARTCKSWLRVSRDPAAWANVRVELRGARPPDPVRPRSRLPRSWWEVYDPNIFYLPATLQVDDSPTASVLSAARALLHAPTLRAIVLDWESLSAEEGVLATSALRRCRAAEVREVRLVGSSLVPLAKQGHRSDDESALAAVIRLLRRNRDSLRVFDTLIMPDRRPGDIGMMDALAEMRRLEELRLRVPGGAFYPRGRYAGQLRDRLPRLRVLVIEVFRDRVPGKNSAALVADLLRGAAASLRVFDMADFSLLDDESALGALAACTGLRELRCDLIYAPAVRGMTTHLRHLHLELCHCEELTEPQLRECLRAVEQDCGEALAGVRVLELHADAGYDGRALDFEHMPLVMELFAAVARGACHAEDVRAHLLGFGGFARDPGDEAAAGPLLRPACLPRVRRLLLQTRKPADVELVADLPDSLASVVGDVYCDTRLLGRVTLGRRAVARLNAERPHLEVDIRVHEVTPQ